MSITSLEFAGFALLTLAIYYALPRRPQNGLLLIASYAFYVSWSWWYALILAALTAANFVIAPRLRVENKQNRALLWLGIGANLLALAIFKYEDFFVPDLRAALDDFGINTGLDVLLPIGMSFYVVAAISYLLDVYRGQAQAARDPVDFALYMAYFPKLLAGPIERARAFLPRLQQQRIVDNDALARSLTLVVVGVVRKVVIADTLFLALPDDLWSAPRAFSGPELIWYLLVYAFAIYNDFAGYTSIARGVSGFFGIELSPNFNLPYFSRNLSEFWNRWHITLSHWLRDYIYYPTSRALLRRNPRRDNIPNILFPPMLTMLASGLWHGPGWPVLLWGAIHGVFLIVERLMALRWPAGPPHLQPRWRQTLAMGVVFALVVLAWVPFRAPDIPTALDYWQGMLSWSGGDHPVFRLLIVLVPALWIDWVQQRRENELVFLAWPRLTQAALLALAILVVFLFSQADTGAPFVYQGF